MNCPDCNEKMDKTDATYSNINTHRARIGQHTGDIHTCNKCEHHYINNFLTDEFEIWSY